MGSLERIFDKDAHTRKDNPTTNYGSSVSFEVLHDESDVKDVQRWYGWASVDFSDLGITDENDVTAAKAHLYLTDGIGWDALWQWSRRNTPAWTESGIWWDNQPTWTTPLSDEVGGWGYAPGYLWLEWDILLQIKDAVTSRGSLWDAVLQCSDSPIATTKYLKLHSKDYADAAYHPHIHITYTTEEGVTKTAVYIF